MLQTERAFSIRKFRLGILDYLSRNFVFPWKFPFGKKKIVFHLHSFRNFRIFWVNGKQPLSSLGFYRYTTFATSALKSSLRSCGNFCLLLSWSYAFLIYRTQIHNLPIRSLVHCPDILLCNVTDKIWLRYYRLLAEFYGYGKYLTSTILLVRLGGISNSFGLAMGIWRDYFSPN